MGGEAAQVAVAADDQPFGFTNGLNVDQQNGMVYFTDSSTHFQRRDYILAVIAGDATGRLMKYNPKSKLVTVLKKGLAFPNGVALNKDNTFLIVAETTRCRLLRYWLQGPKTGTLEIFAQLPGYPDNIKKNPKGEFWVALNQEKVNGKVDWSFERPVGMRFSENGEVLEVLKGRVWTSISEVQEGNGTLWVGSVVMPYVGVYNN
ncbi:Strictosidine synthase protein [Dioscorea alata]|uniref:Strictosidine synthase protein n=1 Tax=Dioscorea alata TaxID=55571 RepID=A0ACB7VK67_DIOAL|nr:Strictosidine synthase protein [Dioscorea alata]